MYFSAIEVEDHMYWNVGTLFPSVHGETMLMFWFTVSIVLSVLNVGTVEIGTRHTRHKEYLVNYVVIIAQGALGENEYLPWLSFCGSTMSLIVASNWIGTLLPWQLINLPVGEIRSLSVDPNFTVALALLSIFNYYNAAILVFGPHYFLVYIKDGWGFIPIYILEDLSKPLSLSFRLLGNVIADEIIVSVLIPISPYGIPLPLMINGLIGGSVQGVVYATLSCTYIAEALKAGTNTYGPIVLKEGQYDPILVNYSSNSVD